MFESNPIKCIPEMGKWTQKFIIAQSFIRLQNYAKKAGDFNANDNLKLKQFFFNVTQQIALILVRN